MPAATWERRFVASFALALVVVPPIVRELYPFSLPSMFSRAIARLARYDATDLAGEPVQLAQLHLHVPEWHDPPVRTLGRDGYGRRVPPSAHVLGQVASRQEIERAVRWSLRRDPTLPATVLVRQRVMARDASGALALHSDQTWRIDREDPRARP